ncbi:mRNA-degrading endonuclease YafQ of YafQ-DinJ toxin-antitoxin module [Bartonella japonica]|uniref:DNA-directed DNA polymerase n=1 Tax=Bartonella japonica TaxID=357761 RepID=A0ABV2FNN3_9HYPH
MNIEDTNYSEVFTIDEGNVVELLLKFMKKQPKNSRFYAHNLTYDYAIIRSWCHFNPDNKITPTNNDFITNNDKILKLQLSFKSKKITLVDSYPLFLSPLKDVMKSFTDLEKGTTPLYETIEDVIITKKDVDYCLNDSVGLAIAIKKRFEFGNNEMTLASGAKSIWSNKMAKNFPELKQKL